MKFSVSPTRITPLNASTVSVEGDSIVLKTDPEQWAWSAQALFAVPDINDHDCEIAVALEMERGSLAVGWLEADELAWVSRSSPSEKAGSMTVRVIVPAGTSGGKFVFVNCTPRGKPALARVTSIEIIGAPDAAAASAKFSAGEAAEASGDVGAATEHYRAALRFDPSHLEAIVGLGRLCFVPPKQPLLDEMKRRSPPRDYCGVVIAIRNPCNYRCSYCVGAGQNNTPVMMLDFDRLKAHFDSVGDVAIGTSFECGGGEPTVHPQFSELLRFCAKYGSVDFPTNNSQDPRRWLPLGVGRRLQIRGALHPQGESNIQKYLDYAKFLGDAGCRFRCDFIGHPLRLDKIEYYSDLFAKHEIPLIVIPFIGSYRGRSYPYSFTTEEKALMEPYAPQDSAWGTYVRISGAVNRIRNFRGIPCLNGYNYVYIDSSHTMHRCVYDERPMSGRMKRPEICNVKHCGCGIPLENLNNSETEFWPKLAELNGMAQTLGHDSAEAGVAAEYVQMYDAMMSAYGKEEFPE
jgi:hypothetical protein